MRDERKEAMDKMQRIIDTNPLWKNRQYLQEFNITLHAVTRNEEDACTFMRGALVGSAHAVDIEANFGEFRCVPNSDVLDFMKKILLGAK